MGGIYLGDEDGDLEDLLETIAEWNSSQLQWFIDSCKVFDDSTSVAQVLLMAKFGTNWQSHWRQNSGVCLKDLFRLVIERITEYKEVTLFINDFKELCELFRY